MVIFGRELGHKSKKRDPYQQEKPPARINNRQIPSQRRDTVTTDGSATNNGWENASGGIGTWYANGNRGNRALKIEAHLDKPASSSRAELNAILETPRQNETDLTIESGSMESIKAICKNSVKYEDQGWDGIQDTDLLLKGILIRLRTRPHKQNSDGWQEKTRERVRQTHWQKPGENRKHW